MLTRRKPYKYLGKSVTLNGEDPEQITGIITTYKELVEQVCSCQLPLSLKVCALNNMALAKVIHFFCNTRFEEKQLVEIDTYLTNKVRNLFSLYKSTTRDVIFLPRTSGGIGVKLFSAVYYCTRVAFIVKMLNHNEESFRNISRKSLLLDMKKRGVNPSVNINNFLGFSVNGRGFVESSTYFGCKTNWIELNRYCRKLDILVQWVDDKATVIIDGEPCNAINLNKALYNHHVKSAKLHVEELTLQGAYMQLKNIDEKISHTIHYNWKLNDQLLIFLVKARLNILPTNFTLYIWNRENNPRCEFCNHSTKSMAHLLNGCQLMFGNFYNKRHNRIANYLYEKLRTIYKHLTTYNNKLMETIFPEHCDILLTYAFRKPDIVIVDPIRKSIDIIEVTICYDLYFDLAQNTKIEKYDPLKNVLMQLGYAVNLYVLCFGSLGTIMKDCSHIVRKLCKNKDKAKEILKWCSISNIIGANYIWRNRVKRLLVEG